MQQGRNPDFARITPERSILRSYLSRACPFVTQVPQVTGGQEYRNPVSEEVLGAFRSPRARKLVLGDTDFLDSCRANDIELPSFLEARPRAQLRFDPHRVRVAVVTTGGLAPGLNSVVHSIVKRHWQTYQIGAMQGRLFGVYNSFRGLCKLADNHVELKPDTTEEWLEQGGSKLGVMRFYPSGYQGDASMEQIVTDVTHSLEHNAIDVLYIIGGDGSLKVAHKIAEKNPTRSIVGVPKTMDNDILWVWQSFGFNTAVAEATRVINTLRSEAESTRRVCVIELFGAESGFVAANAALASGHVDLVLIPEVFALLEPEAAGAYLEASIDHVQQVVRANTHSPHAVLVVAEGVGAVLESKGMQIHGRPVEQRSFIEEQLKNLIGARVRDARGDSITVVVNQPRHYIRSVPANAHDQVYCERLGALAVDNALAGYTDFMISQWMSEFVLVPLELVGRGKKSIPVNGMFWKQVVNSTGQPLSPVERAVDDHGIE